MDVGNDKNCRLRFIGTDASDNKEVCLDIGCIRAVYYGGKKTPIYSKEDYNAMHIDTYKHEPSDKTGYKACYGFDLDLHDLQRLEAPFNNKIAYTHDNILKAIKNLTGIQFDSIKLLDQRYIKGFSWDDFNSCKYSYDKQAYDNAQKLEAAARPKIMSIKKNVKYDNSSYYFDGDKFRVLIHYNCYNDIIDFDVNNMGECLKQIESYKLPEEEIKKAIANHGYKSNKLWC